MWMPSPHNNTPTIMAISSIEATHSNLTQQFNIVPLIEWINLQLSDLFNKTSIKKPRSNLSAVFLGFL